MPEIKFPKLKIFEIPVFIFYLKKKITVGRRNLPYGVNFRLDKNTIIQIRGNRIHSKDAVGNFK